MYNILKGDSYELIKDIPTGSVDLIITDPPYLISKVSYRDNDRLTSCASKLINELTDAGLTDGLDYSILPEFVRIMKKINLYIWCNKKQIPDYLNYFVKELGCSYDILVWIKSNPMPLCGRNYINDKEYCLYFRKGATLHTTYESGKTYWITPTNTKDKKLFGHPTIKPLEIMETLIQNSSYPGDMVADFFVGSGTTGVAAVKHDRSFIGIEKCEEYYKIAINRMKSLS